MFRQKFALPDRLRWLRISSLWVYRALTWSVLAAGFAFAGIVLALRYWILPDIGNYREDIARIVSERAHQKVTIGKISANWDGLRPQLVLEQVVVLDAAGRPAFELERVDNTLSWLSLPTLQLRFHALDIYRPTLNILRDVRGVISVGGIEVTGGDGGGFSVWLLRQRDVEVHDATIIWNDEHRGAPQLELKNVHFQLFNRGARHRFGVSATPPRTLAAPLDLRGDFRTRSSNALADWDGELFLQLDYVDIAAWRTWVPFPVQFPRGAGALRAWLTFSEHRVVQAVADVRLANVLTRLAEDLPQLELTELSGRAGWKQSETELEISTSGLGLTTTGGLKLPPTDFLFRMTTGDKRSPARGELYANALELTPLVALADHLPLGDVARKQLKEYSPKGGLYDVVMHWRGKWRDPEEYSARGQFRNLVLNRVGKVPGFTGVSGTLEASERGGTLSLNSRKASVNMPMVFRDAHEFDALTAQVAWSRSGGETELRLNNVSFSNAHLAGSVSGVYRTAGSTGGDIDLTGSLSRADARFVSRYIPLVVGQGTRNWLDAAFIAGQSSNVSLRLKGNLDQFPFPDGKGGVFQVAARITGGVLHYADDWPRIENIAGDLVFRGQRMDVRARQGTIYGVHLSKTHVEMPDLAKALLNVSGEAEGPTSDFLMFIEKSPVSAMIDRFTEGWAGQGAGKLALKFSLPLGEEGKAKVTGAYQLTNNTVTIARELPALEQAGGRVEFTESGVRVQNVSGVVLGGPVTITASTARDSTVRVNLQGRINTDNARRSPANPGWVRNVRGATDWRVQINARQRNADVIFESSLRGLAVDLPAPLAKTAAETLPVRFERRLLAANQDRLSLAIGDIVSMHLLRRIEGGNTTITRGSVRFGGAASEPDRNGVWATGTMKALDVDRWRALLGRDGGDTRVEWGGIDLKLGAVDAMGRHFGEMAVGAAFQGGLWRAAVSGKELDGTATWQPQGYGKLTARMKTLTIPAAPLDAPPPGDAQARKDAEQPQPELDIVAEQFINKDKPLGRLELVAVPEGRNWRIERLRLTNPESTFTLDGFWQIGPVRPHTQVNVRLEASDVGKLLARLGYPEGVRRGTSKLEGTVSWAGAPYDLDYSTLSGVLTLKAAKGQFVKLDPGVAKLLGILSLQALPRRATLDFRDVFSEGFAFDEIAGSIKINSGVATTENFRIQGPAATVVMLGEVDLAQETQNLKVRIAPQVSETVAIGAALVGGPVAGIAAYLAQKVLKDPFGQFVAYEYSVTGSWLEPNVTRIRAPTAPAQQPTSE